MLLVVLMLLLLMIMMKITVVVVVVLLLLVLRYTFPLSSNLPRYFLSPSLPASLPSPTQLSTRVHTLQVENRQSYDTNPIYAIMHESIYLSGDGVEGPSGWSAERVLAEDPEVR